MATELASYKLQLQQVEAALTADPGNEELEKLKTDLEDVIALTLELQGGEQAEADVAEDSTSQLSSAPRQWAVGNKVLAPWSSDGMHYGAVIEEILPDGSCTVTFEKYDQSEVVQVSQLRPYEEKTDEDPEAKKKKRDQWAAQREARKKKSEKKRARLRQLEEERESEKQKWKSFNQKIFSKTNKGRVKKSIFATPDANTGRVGIGTCNLSGKPMTQSRHSQMYKKHL